MVNGTTITSKIVTITTSSDVEHFNQVAWDHYVEWYNNNKLDTSVSPVTFQNSSDGNDICKAK